MSIEAMTWALGVPIGGNQKVVLLGLANHAHPDGSEAYPSLETLARYAACDRSTARRNVRKLLADGWIVEDGLGPKGTAKYRLAVGVANCHPSQNGTVASVHEGGGISAAGGVAPVLPEPSLEPSKEPSTSPATDGARGWAGVPDEMRSDAIELLRVKTKVAGRIVSEPEMRCVAVAVAEFNRQGGARFSVGAKPHFQAIVQRVREHPSWEPARYARLVQSAWRIRWWSRRGGGRRPDPRVVFGENCFERVVQDAIDEQAARRELDADRGLRGKVWPDGRTFEELTPAAQANAREAVAMGLRPWEEREDPPARAVGNGDGNGRVAAVTAANFLEDE